MPELPCGAVLFDMDGVLVDSRPAVERTWRRWAARHGLDAERLIAVAHGRRSSDTIREQVPHLADIAGEVAWLDAAELADLEGIVPVPGAAALLRALPRNAWAIFTSCTPDLAARRLAHTGLPVPDVLVTSSDVARGKPAPDGWRLAAERLGTMPNDCVVIEDAPPGIAAARALGIPVIGVTTTHPAAHLEGAAAIVGDLTRVRARVEGARLRGLFA